MSVSDTTPAEREAIADEQCRRDGIRRVDPIQLHKDRWNVLEDIPTDLRVKAWHSRQARERAAQ